MCYTSLFIYCNFIRYSSLYSIVLKFHTQKYLSRDYEKNRLLFADDSFIDVYIDM